MATPTPGGHSGNPKFGAGGGAGGFINGGRGAKSSGLSGSGNLSGRGYWPNSQYTGNGGNFTGVGGRGGGQKPYSGKSHFGGKAFRPGPKGNNGKKDFYLNNSRKNIGSGDPNKYRPWNQGNKNPVPKSKPSRKSNYGNSNQLQNGNQSNNSNPVSVKSNNFRDVIIRKAQAFKSNLSSLIGRGVKKENQSTPQLNSPKLEIRGSKLVFDDPPFLGGQVLGKSYRYRIRYDVYSWGNPWITNKLSNEKIDTGPIIGIVMAGTELRPALQVAFTAVNGNVAYRTIDSASFNGITYENARFEYIERLDNTSQEDDRTEGGDPPPPSRTEPPKFVGTLGITAPSSYTPPPTIKMDITDVIFHGPGGFWIDPKPTWTNTGKPIRDGKPDTTGSTTKTPTPSPSSKPQSTGQPTPQPITKPTGGSVSFGGTGTGTSAGTGIGTSIGTSTSTGISTSTETTNNLSPKPTPAATGGNAPPFTPTGLGSPAPEGASKRVANPKPITVQQPTTNTQTNSPSPTVPPAAGGTSGCSSCMKGLHNKVDGLSTALNVGNAVGQAVDLGLLTVINNKLGPQVDGGLSGWLGRFSKSLRLDRAMNALNTLLLLHNALLLSGNVADTFSYFLDSGLDAFGLKDEDDNPIDIRGFVGGFVSSTIQSIVGEELYTGASKAWRKASAIYRSITRIYELWLSSLSGIAEGLETSSRYIAIIGNALKYAGVVVENHYEWMDENVRVKTGRIGKIGKVLDGLDSTENVISELSEITENISETTENVEEIQNELQTIRDETQVKVNEKTTEEQTAKTDSEGAFVDTNDLIKPED